jgi:sulfatase maturation enzyme AslB (radical SAM superfamily)
MKNLMEEYRRLLNSVPVIEIEVSTLCNIKCRVCPRTAITRPKGRMQKSTFDDLVNWLPSGIGVGFSGMGEPLLNDSIELYLSILKKKNIQVIIKTNGLLLTPALLNRLIAAGVWHIQISIHSGIRDEYEQKMKGAKFDKLIDVLGNISRTPNAPVSIYTINDTSAPQNAGSVKELAEQYNLPFFCGEIHSRAGSLYKPRNEEQLRSGEFECRIFPKIIFITWDGNIPACSHDLEGKTSLGNLKDISYRELKLKKWDIIKSGNWFPICKDCDDQLRYTFLSEEAETVPLNDTERDFIKNN